MNKTYSWEEQAVDPGVFSGLELRHGSLVKTLRLQRAGAPNFSAAGFARDPGPEGFFFLGCVFPLHGRANVCLQDPLDGKGTPPGSQPKGIIKTIDIHIACNLRKRYTSKVAA